jgi:hypothetical protein
LYPSYDFLAGGWTAAAEESARRLDDTRRVHFILVEDEVDEYRVFLLG